MANPSWTEFEENWFPESVVHVCGFQDSYTDVTESRNIGKQFWLMKDNQEEIFSFPAFHSATKEEISHMASWIISCLQKAYRTDVECPFSFFVQEDNDFYLFYDCSAMHVEAVRLNQMNDLWLVTYNEIAETGYVMEYSVDERVTQIVQRYFQCDQKYVIVYVSCDERKIHFYMVFGVPPEDLSEKNYYVFHDYETSFHQEEPGWVRVALFPGNTKVIDGFFPEGLDDDLWDGGRYDSLYYTESKTWVLREYERQQVLTAHLKDKEGLEDVEGMRIK